MGIIKYLKEKKEFSEIRKEEKDVFNNAGIKIFNPDLKSADLSEESINQEIERLENLYVQVENLSKKEGIKRNPADYESYLKNIVARISFLESSYAYGLVKPRSKQINSAEIQQEPSL